MTVLHVTACRQARQEAEEEEAKRKQDASESISTTKKLDITLT
jgi:hypothetical protein